MLDSRNELVVYKKPGASKPYYVVSTSSSHGPSGETCSDDIVTKVESYHALSYKSGNQYGITLENYFITLDKDMISFLGCQNMVVGRKYKIQ